MANTTARPKPLLFKRPSWSDEEDQQFIVRQFTSICKRVKNTSIHWVTYTSTFLVRRGESAICCEARKADVHLHPAVLCQAFFLAFVKGYTSIYWIKSSIQVYLTKHIYKIDYYMSLMFFVLLDFQLNPRGCCKISHFGGRLKFCRRYGRQMLRVALNTHICLATELSNTRHPGQGVGIKKGGDKRLI